MNNIIKNWEKNKNFLKQNHIYNDLDEHSSCGVGLIASLHGEPNQEVVQMGVQALK